MAPAPPFLFHPSFYKAQHSQEGGKGETSVNEDLEPWGLQQHLLLIGFSLTLELLVVVVVGHKDRSGMKEMASD